MGHKAVPTHNINNTFGPGTANKCTVQWWFKKFCKGNESLEEEKHSGWPLEVNNDHWEPLLKLLLLYEEHEKLPKNSMLTIVRSFGIWSQLERWKSSINGCLMSWLQIRKTKVLKCHLLLFYATNHFLTGLWPVTKSGHYMTTGNDQLNGWTEKKLQSTSQSQPWTRKRSQSLFGGLLPVWTTTAFGIPAKPLHLRSMLSKSMICTGNCNACSWYCSAEGTTSPWEHLATHHTTNVSEVELIRSWSFASFAIFTWPLANWLLLLQASWQPFAGKIPPQPAGGRKWTLSKSSLNSEASTFMLQEWMSLLPVGKNVSTVIVPILSNKDVFEPSYNDLKFMAGTNITFVPT